MKFLVKQQNQRTHLQLYKDKNIDILNVNRVLNQAIDKKELQDVVQSLHSSETITHFTHHSDKQSMDEDFNAE
jgi:predicted RNase H-like nuclease (RuvC/YqgF family)